eukprot:TRINITY_DN12049_c0_g1_i2.p1 TRINITY_DN12049_c0_g1~~TRINITY_DN12049_c0_g1_i2.p1  ORF type:complete len:108 (+),score=5.38 TRINITY_DN12049_c0_g1_i2:40-363(+)
MLKMQNLIRKEFNTEAILSCMDDTIKNVEEHFEINGSEILFRFSRIMPLAAQACGAVKSCAAKERKNTDFLTLAAARLISTSLLVLSSSCMMHERTCRLRATSPRLV